MSTTTFEADLVSAPTEIAVFDAVIHDGVPMMDEQEARACVTRIKTRLDITRGELLELHDREGWKALGYNSWGACVRAEFEGSSTALYRQLAAAKIEREVFGDSRIGNPTPASQLEVVKDLPTEQKRAAFKRADELAGDKPRTAKHIAEAAAEIAQPDLPIEFSLIQRRFESHGYTLAANVQGDHLAFVTRKEGMTGVVTFDWAHVLTKLERIESEPPPPPLDAPDHGPADNAAAYDAKAERDAERIAYAQSCAAVGQFDTARAALNGVQVSTYARDQLLAEIARLEHLPAGRQITLALTPHDCAALLKEAKAFEQSGLTKRLPAISGALVLLVQAIKGMPQPTERSVE